MVVAKIEEIGSHDRVTVVRLLYGHITDNERCRQKEAPLH